MSIGAVMKFLLWFILHTLYIMALLVDFISAGLGLFSESENKLTVISGASASMATYWQP